MGLDESVIELRQEKVDNPLEFLRVLKSAFQNRGNDKSKFNVTHLYVLFCTWIVPFLLYWDDSLLRFSSHLSLMDGFSLGRIVTIHIYYSNTITGENIYSKLSLVDLAGSEGLTMEDDSGDHVTDLLHVMNSISTYVKFLFLFFIHFSIPVSCTYNFCVFIMLRSDKKFHV